MLIKSLLRSSLHGGERANKQCILIQRRYSNTSVLSSTNVNSSQLNPFIIEEGCLVPGIHANEFQARRTKLFSLLPENTALLINGASTKYMTHDIPYEFHQNSNFFYLTGLEEPDVFALFMKNKNESTYILFVQPYDRHREQWDGPRVGTTEAITKYGADISYPIADLETEINKRCKDIKQLYVMAPEQNKYDIKLLEVTKSFHQIFAFGNSFVEQLRLIKSPAELQRMRLAAHVGGLGFQQMMQHSKPDMTEAAVAAQFEATCKSNGATGLSFPCVIGSGVNGAVIHYLAKRNLLNASDLVLADAGCVVPGGYVSDITRTWAVNGKDSLTKPQILLYDLLLQVQIMCLNHLESQIQMKKSITLDELHQYSVTIMLDGFRQMGLLQYFKEKNHADGSEMAYFRRYNPTHIGHYLGMDVHDTPHMSRNKPLQPGMVITVEPGIYFHQNDEYLPQEFRGLGIRIEDDVVITDSGIEILTSQIPKSLEDVDALRG